jgi:predicted ester cyclase
MDQKAHYQKYIDTLNGNLSGHSLDAYIKEGIIFNGTGPWTASQCVENITDVQKLLPGLHFHIEKAVWEPAAANPRQSHADGQLAVRARITYQAQAVGEVTFYEHAIYEIEGNKIVRCDSLVDTEGVPDTDKAAAKRL